MNWVPRLHGGSTGRVSRVMGRLYPRKVPVVSLQDSTVKNVGVTSMSWGMLVRQTQAWPGLTAMSALKA